MELSKIPFSFVGSDARKKIKRIKIDEHHLNLAVLQKGPKAR